MYGRVDVPQRSPRKGEGGVKLPAAPGSTPRAQGRSTRMDAAGSPSMSGDVDVLSRRRRLLTGVGTGMPDAAVTLPDALALPGFMSTGGSLASSARKRLPLESPVY